MRTINIIGLFGKNDRRVFKVRSKSQNDASPLEKIKDRKEEKYIKQYFYFRSIMLKFQTILFLPLLSFSAA